MMMMMMMMIHCFLSKMTMDIQFNLPDDDDDDDYDYDDGLLLWVCWLGRLLLMIVLFYIYEMSPKQKQKI